MARCLQLCRRSHIVSPESKVNPSNFFYSAHVLTQVCCDVKRVSPQTLEEFKLLELSVFFELVHHLIGIKSIKRHLLVNFIAQSFILTCVVPWDPIVSPFPT